MKTLEFNADAAASLNQPIKAIYHQEVVVLLQLEMECRMVIGGEGAFYGEPRPEAIHGRGKSGDLTAASDQEGDRAGPVRRKPSASEGFLPLAENVL